MIYSELEGEIKLLTNSGILPHLAVVLVGENPASKVYVTRKQKSCEKIGLSSKTFHLDDNIAQADLLELVHQLNNDPTIHGILVQLPLPRHISETLVIESIRPTKDVDGFHPVNRGRLMSGEDCFVPCTPGGIQQLLIRNGLSPEGRHIVVVGRSMIVGLPFAILMMQKKSGANATVTVCHTGSGDLKRYTKTADILIAAIGRPNSITSEMVSQGCIVVDVGINRVDDPQCGKGYRLVGDVDFEAVKPLSGAITPVPGGVGPMTIAMLVSNTVKAAKLSLKT